jgi:formamidopyrimidine-DNA glycosylase
MPELPEVETIVRDLARSVVGKRIESADVRLPKMAQAPPGLEFRREVAGEPIAAIGRRGKYVVMELASGRRLVTSLRMTGRLVVACPERPEDPGTHVVLRFAGGTQLRFADVRTFGRMRLVEAADPWDRELGVEPLSCGFTQEAFIGMLAGRKTPVKVLLLDQRRIAGIGNIYACEALWEARIRPSRPARALTKPAISRLRLAIADVLARAIARRGSSVDDYVDGDGLLGSFQNDLAVYGRLGERCPRCDVPIVRTVLAGRGTWWCRRCQR